MPLDIDLDNDNIQRFSKGNWKTFLDRKTKMQHFCTYVRKTLKKENTRDIVFQSLEMSGYLKENKRKSLSQIIFDIRSKTLNIKEFQPLSYEDNLCVKCEKISETIYHFSTCNAYETEPETNWRDIYIDETARQIEIAEHI